MLGELNDKLNELSRNLVSLHVKEVLNKNKQENNMKLRNLSDEEKENLRNIFKDLEAQVNAFVQKTVNNAEEEDEEVEKKTRTVLRDLVRKKNK